MRLWIALCLCCFQGFGQEVLWSKIHPLLSVRQNGTLRLTSDDQLYFGVTLRNGQYFVGGLSDAWGYIDNGNVYKGFGIVRIDANGDTLEIINYRSLPGLGLGPIFSRSDDSLIYAVYTGANFFNNPLIRTYGLNIRKYRNDGTLIWHKFTPSAQQSIGHLQSVCTNHRGGVTLTVVDESFTVPGRLNLRIHGYDSSGIRFFFNDFPLGGQCPYIERTPGQGYLLTYLSQGSVRAMELDSLGQVQWDEIVYTPPLTGGFLTGSFHARTDGGYYGCFTKSENTSLGTDPALMVIGYNGARQRFWADSSLRSGWPPGHVTNDNNFLVMGNVRRPTGIGTNTVPEYHFKQFRWFGEEVFDLTINPPPDNNRYNYHGAAYLGNGDAIFVGDYFRTPGNTTASDFLITKISGVGVRWDPGAPVRTSTQAKAIPQSVLAYPNPSKGFLGFTGLPAGKHTVQLVNLQGQTVLEQTFVAGRQINVSQLPSGLYRWRIAGERAARGNAVVE